MRRRAFLALSGAALCAPGAMAPDLARGVERVGRLSLPRDDGRLRGLSAIHLYPGGAQGLVLSDRGHLAEVTFERDAQEGLRAVMVDAIHPLGAAGSQGASVDAEGLAVSPAGTIHVALEGARGGAILALAHPGAPAMMLAPPPGARGLPRNKGIETLAVDAGGRLIALPETWTRAAGGFWPVWRRDAGGGWDEIGRIARDGPFRPVAADIAADGALWLLERAVALTGFAARLRRFAPGLWGEGETALETAPGVHGNLEGLSLWADSAGRLRATMVADDNLIGLQRSEIVEYRLP
jgi:hypothetical protein